MMAWHGDICLCVQWTNLGPRVEKKEGEAVRGQVNVAGLKFSASPKCLSLCDSDPGQRDKASRDLTLRFHQLTLSLTLSLTSPQFIRAPSSPLSSSIPEDSTPTTGSDAHLPPKCSLIPLPDPRRRRNYRSGSGDVVDSPTCV